MRSLFIRTCLLAICFVLLIGTVPASTTTPALAAPLPPPVLTGRNCGSTTLTALTHVPGLASVRHPIQDASRWDASQPVEIDTPTAAQRTPVVAVDQDGTLHLLFTDGRNGDDDIYTARSTDGGQTWTAGVQITDAMTSTQQIDPSVWVAADGSIHAVWKDSRRNLNDIYAAHSSDGGQTWSENIRANLDSGVVLRSAPLLVGNVDVLLAGWVQLSDTGAAGGNLVIVRSTDGGQSWQRSNPVNSMPNTVFDGGFSLVSDPGSGRLYAVWIGIPAGSLAATQILMASSDDGGETWINPVQIHDSAEDARKASPVLAIDKTSGRLLAAWEDYRALTPQVRLVSSSDGQNWSSSVQVDTSEGSAYNPRLVIDSLGTGHCIFCQERSAGGGTIYAAEIDSANQVSREQVSDELIVTSQSLLTVAIDRQDTIYTFWTNGTATGEGIFTARRPSEKGILYLPLIVR